MLFSLKAVRQQCDVMVCTLLLSMLDVVGLSLLFAALIGLSEPNLILSQGSSASEKPMALSGELAFLHSELIASGRFPLL